MTTRERLAKMLAEAGYPLAMRPLGALGHYRINAKFDDTTVCWQARALPSEGEYLSGRRILSYDTMTACVRYGFDTGELLGDVWVYAKKRRGA